MNITTQQYLSAIKNALNPKQLATLNALFELPFSRATAKELAQVLSPANPKPIVANWSIGGIGKSMTPGMTILFLLLN